MNALTFFAVGQESTLCLSFFDFRVFWRLSVTGQNSHMLLDIQWRCTHDLPWDTAQEKM